MVTITKTFLIENIDFFSVYLQEALFEARGRLEPLDGLQVGHSLPYLD